METEAAFVQRIAVEYFRLYKDVGFNKAAEYAERVIGNNPVLEDQVRRAVEGLVAQEFTGGGSGPK